jgi:hypothetical protein
MAHAKGLRCARKGLQRSGKEVSKMIELFAVFCFAIYAGVTLPGGRAGW